MLEVRKRSVWCFFLLALAMLSLGLPAAYGQVATGSFTGTVTDPTGAMIPGATVSATREGTNIVVSRQTGTEGLYTIPELRPAFYTLKAEAKGFKTLVNQHVELTVGHVQRVDFRLEVGAVTETVTVESQATPVDTETHTLSELVTARQVENLPLNGRNIFQLIQLAPGAVNTSGVVDEPGSRGFTTVVNGARVNMNGYLLDGITDKGLSGGSNTQPSVDTVQEFRVETMVLSAQYGSTVGAVTTVITKSGTNSLHGSVYEFLRNDKLNAREFYEGDRNPFRMNQFGATLGGPIVKDKLFFFGSFEGERTRIYLPQSVVVETPEWRNLVMSTEPNSVAALLYGDFPAPAPDSDFVTAAEIVGPDWNDMCAALDADCVTSYGLDPTSGLGAALIADPDIPVFGTGSASARFYSRDQFYNGNQFSAKIDYQTEKHRIFGRYFYDRFKDPYYSPGNNEGQAAAFVAIRGFTSPYLQSYPHGVLAWSYTISPTVLNDLRVGVARGIGDIEASSPGVPNIYFDTGEVQFGAYNGYPQLFHETIFQFTDMVTLSRGRHNLKVGGEMRRNYERSEFNVGRPSYEFLDAIAFAAGRPASVAAGTDPGPIDPTTGQSTGAAHLASNIRDFRNWEFGLFFQDDWKVTPRFTLNLGLRYDIYTRHSEKYGQITELVLPESGANLTERLRAVNCYSMISGAVGYDGQPCNGGFIGKTSALAPSDNNNFSPRIGFAWDIRGNGKTALRGGFGVSYQGEIYNPLSNSRWNPPFYSFNLAFCTDVNTVGPAVSDGCIFGPVAGGTPSYTGDPSNVGTGPAGATFNAFSGNIMGWQPYNANAAFLTGIVFPDFRDPYVYGSHLSLEHEFPGSFVMKASWVGTFGHKLYRAEDINRHFAGRDLQTASGPTFGGVCSLFGPYRVNCLYGRLRVWQNSVNSNYHALQIVLDKRMARGFEWHANYVWSHSLDTRSTWHSGATTSNGASEGFSMDQAHPELDYGNSVFDVRHRFTTSIVWEFPWYKDQRGAAGRLLGGWQINSAISLRGGFHWTPYCSNSSFPGGGSSCDFNRDGVRNDRPNQPGFGSSTSNDRAVFEPDHPGMNFSVGDFINCTTSPRASCANWPGAYNGNLGRNTFLGPSFQQVDMSIFKNIQISEQARLQFRAEAFNIFNRTNLMMPSATFGINASQFGLATSTAFPRQFQFALKLVF